MQPIKYLVLSSMSFIIVWEAREQIKKKMSYFASECSSSQLGLVSFNLVFLILAAIYLNLVLLFFFAILAFRFTSQSINIMKRMNDKTIILWYIWFKIGKRNFHGVIAIKWSEHLKICLFLPILVESHILCSHSNHILLNYALFE